VCTIARGEIVYRDGEVTATPGRGRFTPGAPMPMTASAGRQGRMP
jgi:hypothetical protein